MYGLQIPLGLSYDLWFPMLMVLLQTVYNWQSVSRMVRVIRQILYDYYESSFHSSDYACMFFVGTSIKNLECINFLANGNDV